jgi:hypothetical protein
MEYPSSPEVSYVFSLCSENAVAFVRHDCAGSLGGFVREYDAFGNCF